MNKRLKKLLRKRSAKSGASLTEYAVILFLVSIVAVVILQSIGGKTNNMVSTVNDGFGP